MPTAAPVTMNRCRQVSTTIINARPAYSIGPDLGGPNSSRAWVVSGPGTP